MSLVDWEFFICTGVVTLLLLWVWVHIKIGGRPRGR